MTAPDLETDSTREPADLADRAGDVTVALSPQELAFLAVIAGLILAVLRRVIGGRRRARAADLDRADRARASDREG